MVVLECPSIRLYSMDDHCSLVSDSRLSLHIEHMLIAEAAFDEELFREIFKNGVLYKLKPTNTFRELKKF